MGPRRMARSTVSSRTASAFRLDGAGVVYSNGSVGLAPTELAFRNGELCVLLGPSGAGKSTLLRVLNLLVRPTTGRVLSGDGRSLDGAAEIRSHRRATAMIFQQHHLIGRLSALDNVMMGRLGHHPAWRTMVGFPAFDRRLALDCLSRVGLGDRALSRCDALSGGQQQRVGIARALAQEPRALLADEPIASLDPASAGRVLNLLRSICDEDGLTVVVSLHQVQHARAVADRIVGLDGGRVVFDGLPERLTPDVVVALYGTSRTQETT